MQLLLLTATPGTLNESSSVAAAKSSRMKHSFGGSISRLKTNIAMRHRSPLRLLCSIVVEWKTEVA